MLIASILHRYAIMASFEPVIYDISYNGKRDQVCGECGMYCRDEKYAYCQWGKRKEGYLLKDFGEMG